MDKIILTNPKQKIFNIWAKMLLLLLLLVGIFGSNINILYAEKKYNYVLNKWY